MGYVTAQEWRYAWRQLRRNRGFAVTSVLVLGLGIGVATAMFSVLHAVLLRPLPYAHPDQLVTLEHPPGNIQGEASGPDVRDWQQRSRSFEQIAYSQGGMAWLRQAADTHFVEDDSVSANLFTTLGVEPEIGRGFVASDQSQRAKVAVLGNLLWRQLFQGRRDVIGQTVKLGSGDYTVIGVMPAGFSYPYGDDLNLWTPYAPAPDEAARDDNMLTVVGRLRPGVSAQSAQAELSGIQAGLAREFPSLHLSDRVLVRGYHNELVAGVRPALLALSAGVGLVWLIACFSVAGLLLTRCLARRRELAVRAALGASQSRLAAQLLTESLLLGGLASLCGVGLSLFALASLRHFLATRLPFGVGIALSAGTLVGLLALTLASVVLIGVAPALLAARAPAAAGLRGGAASAAPGQSLVRDGLVVGEIALALVLLASAGLLLRTLYSLRQVPLGFTTENVVTTQLMIPAGRFAHQNMNLTFDQPLLARLEALPGVRAAALTSVIPLERNFIMSGRFRYVDRPNLPPQQQPQGDVRFTSPGYPAVFGIALEQGRFFSPSLDTPTSPTVIVVNHTFAARYFPGGAVGQQIALGPKSRATIVGVLADARDNAIDAPPQPVMHFSTTQIAPGGEFNQGATAFVALAVRTRVPSATVIPAMRRALHALAPDLTPGDFKTMSQIVSDSIGSQIFAARLLGLFAAAALAIALAGLYGLLAFAVTQRTREMGIRLALGARRGQIVGLVLGRAGWLLGLGIAGGLALALAGSHLLAAYLYDVPPRDPLTLAAVALLLAAAGMWSAYLPARRAARVSPVEALRVE